MTSFGNASYETEYVDAEWIVVYKPLETETDENFHARRHRAKRTWKLRLGEPDTEYNWVNVIRRDDGFHVTLRKGTQTYLTKLWNPGAD